MSAVSFNLYVRRAHLMFLHLIYFCLMYVTICFDCSMEFFQVSSLFLLYQTSSCDIFCFICDNLSQLFHQMMFCFHVCLFNERFLFYSIVCYIFQGAVFIFHQVYAAFWWLCPCHAIFKKEWHALCKNFKITLLIHTLHSLTRYIHWLRY